MARNPMTIDEILPLLRETPERISTLAAELTPAQLRAAPAEDQWSVNDVLAHLRACADVWGDCIAAILAADHPTLRAINPRSWIKRTDYPDLEFEPSFKAFNMQRAELLTVLEPLPREDWSRGATVTGAGSPLERTVQAYAAWLARHERSHYRQLARIADAVSA